MSVENFFSLALYQYVQSFKIVYDVDAMVKSRWEEKKLQYFTLSAHAMIMRAFERMTLWFCELTAMLVRRKSLAEMFKLSKWFPCVLDKKKSLQAILKSTREREKKLAKAEKAKKPDGLPKN